MTVRPWRAMARPEQLPPKDGDWLVYLVTVGRGWGKTRAAAEWIAEQAAENPNTRWAVVAPTWRETRQCFVGHSGVLAALMPGELISYSSSEFIVRLSNGSEIYGYPANRSDRLKGATLDGAWLDEVDAFADGLDLWKTHLTAALSGIKPRVFMTATLDWFFDDVEPDDSPLLHHLLDHVDDGVVIHVPGCTWENAANLSRISLVEMERRYAERKTMSCKCKCECKKSSEAKEDAPVDWDAVCEAASKAVGDCFEQLANVLTRGLK